MAPPPAAPAMPMNAANLLNQTQVSKRILNNMQKEMRVECPELAGLISLLVHMLIRNKDWATVIATVDQIFENKEMMKNLSQGDKDTLKLRKAVASHKLEFKKPFSSSLVFEEVQANFQAAHPGYHSKRVAARGLRHLEFLQQQAEAVERKDPRPLRGLARLRAMDA
ncbi:unnamed protein product [Effrenium voratum]|uniref:Uncharacterized protein n=1 Tax=Effrenium voratum TaxID=2562239 RepID=A0AA36IIA7_9DINO|nr:unnamed protein product [Effrenium voratum]CAJ1388158.1 unnamed protein product [Effrenium voratum]CAJ1449882.1 unnamed protein product [Effrenium voratum]